MNHFIALNFIVGKLFSYSYSESEPANSTEMIQFSSWEGFLLLFAVIIIVWLLILFQVKSYPAGENGPESYGNHESIPEHHSAGNSSTSAGNLQED